MTLIPLITELRRLTDRNVYINSLRLSTIFQIKRSFASASFFNNGLTERWKQRQAWIDNQGRTQPNYRPLIRTGQLRDSITIRKLGFDGIRIQVPESRPAGYQPPIALELNTPSALAPPLLGDIHLFGGINEKGYTVPQRQFIPITAEDTLPQQQALVRLWDKLSRL